MRKSVPAIALAFALGVLVGGIAGFDPGTLGGPAADGPGSDSDTVPLAWGTGGPGCFDGPTPHAGWVHEVANGETYAVTLNATVVHDPGEAVEPNATEWAPGRYRLDLRTVPDDGKPKTSGDCRVASDIRVATSLPTDYEQFEIAVNGRTVRTVEREDTTADLYQLPNPVNATASG